jgi:hypothetical protein
LDTSIAAVQLAIDKFGENAKPLPAQLKKASASKSDNPQTK